MNLGYYYHIDVKVGDGGRVWVPAHLGMLVHGIAERVGRITYYGHAAADASNPDFELAPPLVNFVDLGPRRAAPLRTFMPMSSLRSFDPTRDGIDAMLMSAPTPLLPALIRRCSGIPTAVIVGGDYGTWQPRSTYSRVRNLLVQTWVAYYRRAQRRATDGIPVIAQNPLLLDSVGPRGDRVVVPLSSVSAADLAAVSPRSEHVDADLSGRPVRLIYTGRIVQEKGLFEAVVSLRLLADRGYDVTLDIVGWEEPGESIRERMEDDARRLGVDERLRFLGYRAAGPALLETYTSADIFVLPTYGDSVPRSMQEAMAVGLPVIASAVGGIAHYLRDREHALLIEPRSPDAIADAVQVLIDDRDLRAHITRVGADWARSYTSETSCDEIAKHLRAWVSSHQRSPSGSGSKPRA